LTLSGGDMKRLLSAIGFAGLLAVAAPCGWTQSQRSEAQMPAFEVASVRAVPAGRAGQTTMSPFGAAQFATTNASLEYLIQLAFDVRGQQIAGKPGWLSSELYDISAKPEGDGGLSYEQLKPLLQQLLMQRFHLAIHRETKNMPGYALVVAKGGPKLEASKGTSGMGAIMADGLRAQNISMQGIAAMLWFPAGAPVIDKTGIMGTYDISLSFAPEGSADSALPSLFTAVQEQMGLKLEAQKVPVQMLVIDHVDKIPTDN